MEQDDQYLKAHGFLPQVQADYFSLRLRIAGGQLTTAQLQAAQTTAERYGRGQVHLTSRQSVEIPFIQRGDIAAVTALLAEAGLEPAAGGARVRTVTACQGKAVCKSGLIDTSALARELDRRYYGRHLPHKFKLGVTGCRNNCLKAEENDLGIKGAVVPVWQAAACNFCGACAASCPGQAIHVKRGEALLSLNTERCLHCGKCLKICRRQAWQGEAGYVLSFGGLFGNTIAQGKNLLPVITRDADLHQIIESVLAFFAEHGRPKERFRRTVERVGWEKLTAALAKGS